MAMVKADSSNKRTHVDSFKVYKFVHSKPIIEEIDDCIGYLFGLKRG